MSSRKEVPASQNRPESAPVNPLTALAELTGTLTSILEPSTVIEATISEVARVLPYLTAIVVLLDKERGDLYIAASSGLSEEEKKVRVNLGVGLLGELMATGRAIWVSDTSKESRFNRVFYKSLSRDLMLAPIIVDGSPGGAIAVSNENPGTYTKDDFQLLVACANATSIALKNAQLYANQREETRIRDEFLSIVSHEVRNPLSLIKGLAQTIQRRRGKEGLPRENEELSVIVEQTDRISRLVNDLLDVSRIERRVLSLALEPVHMPTLLADVQQKLAPVLSHHALVLTVPDSFPQGNWDKDRLVQALTNLMENAGKYTPSGGRISVSCEAFGEEALVRVADNGIGIQEGHLNRIFDRFFRVQQMANLKVGGGVGIGLYVTKGIIEAHGGRIWVKSEVGKGSEFCFSLPLRNAEKPKP